MGCGQVQGYRACFRAIQLQQLQGKQKVKMGRGKINLKKKEGNQKERFASAVPTVIYPGRFCLQCSLHFFILLSYLIFLSLFLLRSV